ncbi:MAG: type II toxin-antitoxin system Phd/YefM family antitoxin [Candidatus Hydrogenedentes bacterium]|nr:type II toxin-antitoxin system Phd/YefM family antitoxin [Candidatus Hydrogenedentota bacterium]
MIQAQESYTLVEFTQHAMDHIARLKSSGQPEVLTVDGKAEVVVQDAAAYQALLDRLDSIEAIASVKASMAEFERGEGIPFQEGIAALREKHGIPSLD